MKIIEIGCTTDGNNDGIGKHTRIVTDEMNKRNGVQAMLISGDTLGYSNMQMLFSQEMMKAFHRAARSISTEKIDYVVVEYPFSEYNPLIVMAFSMLKRVCHKYGTHIGLSMHEYDRVNFLRKLVVKNFVKNADFVYVSDPVYLIKLKKLNAELYLRTIPNHLPMIEKKKKLIRGKYVYFGLVNKSKAFEEMIFAWDEFNKNKENLLRIVTASDIQFDESAHRNIKIFKGVSNEYCLEILWDSMFSILPIKPEIGFNNSSFIATIQCGCIPIGHFSDGLKKESFVIDVENQSSSAIIDGLDRSVSLTDDEILYKSHNALSYGKVFTIESTVDMMLRTMEEKQIVGKDEQ